MNVTAGVTVEVDHQWIKLSCSLDQADIDMALAQAGVAPEAVRGDARAWMFAHAVAYQRALTAMVLACTNKVTDSVMTGLKTDLESQRTLIRTLAGQLTQPSLPAGTG